MGFMDKVKDFVAPIEEDDDLKVVMRDQKLVRTQLL